MAGVLLLPSAGFLIIFCCVYCTYRYLVSVVVVIVLVVVVALVVVAKAVVVDVVWSCFLRRTYACW